MTAAIAKPVITMDSKSTVSTVPLIAAKARPDAGAALRDIRIPQHSKRSDRTRRIQQVRAETLEPSLRL
jgi:hypothetical protein